MIEQPVMSFLIGFKHSLEADHIATVLSIKNNNKLKGLIWAIGHSFSILVLSSLMYFLNFKINEMVECPILEHQVLNFWELS